MSIIVLEFYRLEHIFVQTSAVSKENFMREKNRQTLRKDSILNFKRTKNVNDDHIGNVGRPRLSVGFRPQNSVHRIASCTGLRRMS